MVTKQFAQHCFEQYKMNHHGYHGFNHWARVMKHGRFLAAKENANLKVVELFCIMHDTQRQNENRDPMHGCRAAKFAHKVRGIWFDISDRDMRLLDEALTYHSDGYTDADITVQTCWDADRLDLGRVGIKLNPKKLCTQTAKDIIIELV
tara:strand:- start:1425 stop:1871 length:447 start_codon:yes stop_codon:yes gene_type:complete